METIVMDLYNNDQGTRLLDYPGTTRQGNATTNQDNSLPQASTDVSSIIFLLGVLLFIFAFSLLKYWLCEGPAAARRRNQERANRRELIRERILSKTVVRKVEEQHVDESQHSETCSTFVGDESRAEGGLEKDHKHKIRRQKSDLEISVSQHNPDDASRVECQICLCDFQLGDKICWSNNPLCVHAFHIDCLEPWLMKHNHCPLCRNDYLVPPKMDPDIHPVEPTSDGREVLQVENTVRFRGILGDIILPFWHHSTHPEVIHRRSEAGSALTSVPSTNNAMVEEIIDAESPLSLETRQHNSPLHVQNCEGVDGFDVESGESLAR